jgi:class 3 adenylate cyclase
MKRKIAAILAADIAAYSRLVAEDEEETLTRLESLRAVFDDFVHRFGGRIFNRSGDSIMAEFASAVDATRCAIDIQESMRTRNLAFPQSRRMEYRIGITIGDVVERDGDLLGDGVNIAARLEGLAEPGGICVSRTVYESVANKLSVPFLDIGQQEVKNIPQPVHAFRVEWRGGSNRQLASARAGKETRSMAPAILGALGGLAAVAAALAAFLILRPAPEPPIAPSSPPQATVPAPLASAPSQEAPPAIVAAPASPIVAQPPVAAPSTPPVAPPAERQPLPTDPTEALAALAKQGGIVQNPSTAPELFHNARSYETRGDAVAARQSYLAFAHLDLDLIDPLLRFAALLRVQEGRAGAREVFAALLERNKSPAFALVHALQFDGAERTRRVEQFMATHAHYGPAAYLLADEYSESRLGGQQTIGDMKKEMAALQRFLEGDGQGRLQPFFLDHSVLADWTDRARKRIATLEQKLSMQIREPRAIFMRHNAGWSVTVQLPEAATIFAWRIVDRGDFRATGAASTIDPRTGRPAPITWFELPGETEQATIEVRYEDATGRMNGPFAIPFNWRTALVSSQKQILDQHSSSWVQFGRNAPSDNLIYFTHLVTYRCAIAKAEIGFDNDQPNRELPLPACDRRDPTSVPVNAQIHLRAPPAAKSASVRLTYADGAQSDVATFQRP